MRLVHGAEGLHASLCVRQALCTYDVHCRHNIESRRVKCVETWHTWRSSARFSGGLKAGMTNCARGVALYRKWCRAVSPHAPPPALRGSLSRHRRPAPGLASILAITCVPMHGAMSEP